MLIMELGLEAGCPSILKHNHSYLVGKPMP